MPTLNTRSIKVADEVWIATAILHYENPSRTDFSSAEIEQQIREENISGEHRPGSAKHISTHAVAGKPAQPGNYRMLTETGYGRRRLFRDGDKWHESRTGKVVPHRDEIPEKYHYLLDWYGAWSQGGSGRGSGPSGSTGGGLWPPFPKKGRFDGLLRLRGTWTAGDADEFVRKMREDWR